jgi:tetratricopeptide (TPR) repeat protein
VTVQAGLLHERGVAATARGAPAAGAALLRDGLRTLGWPTAVGDQSLVARLLISLAHAEAEQGRLHVGLDLLDVAAPLVAGADRGVCDQQRGLLLLRGGRFAAARECFDVALPLLAAGAHRDIEARTFLNRGVALQATGRIALARRDFQRCVTLAAAAGLPGLAIKAEHNAGYCDFLEGDIPAALRAYANAEQALADEPGLVAIVLVDRARAVLGAGLVREAERDLDRAIELFAKQKLRQDQAEAELARAHASLAAGDNIAAASWARVARARFLRRGNQTGAALAALVLLRVQLDKARVRRDLPAAAAALAATLRRAGLGDDADLATFVGVRALIARAELSAAEVALPSGLHGLAPVELRLIARLAAAELGVARGRLDLARREVNAGLATLHAHRSRMGSLDLQVGTLSPALELAALGVRLAWQSGSARRIYAATEQARAQTLRIRSVRPVADVRLAALIAELRQVRARSRQIALSGDEPDTALRTRSRELEGLVRRHDWETAGSRHTERVTSLPRVVDELERRDAVMISLVESGGQLGAIVVAPRARRTATLVTVGPAARTTEAARRVRADVDMLASRRLPRELDHSVRESLATNLACLGAVIAQVESAAYAHHEGQLVVIPVGAWWLLPWGALPGLRSRPVAAAPSATSWARGCADESLRGARSRGAAVVVGGPDLVAASPEVAAVAACYDHPSVMNGEAATVAATLQAMDGADTVHIAAHGEHDPDNGLFSRIWLSDGPMMAYDVQHLAKSPRHVVLAACDAGRAAVHPGDDLIGFASALLHAGTRTVIASVARVTDEAAQRVMTGYHRGLAGTRSSAEALANTLADDPLVPFVCYGVG